MMKSINPYTREIIAEYASLTNTEINTEIIKCYDDWICWKNYTIEERSKLMKELACLLRKNKRELSVLITSEMGKLISESEGEVEKCALLCEFYADSTFDMLQSETIISADVEGEVCFKPLGIILGVMPWNYPFWQVLRFVIPTMMAGNACLLKHASNVQGCAKAIQALFIQAGFPKNLFKWLCVEADKVEQIIEHDLVRGVSLTGSEYAGSQVAKTAGASLKPSVLELGGSDPFIIFEDADIDTAVHIAIQSRLRTNGQTCISAKRFFVHTNVFNKFSERLISELSLLKVGDPMNNVTNIAPLSKKQFCLELQSQVDRSVEAGATVFLHGGCTEGNLFAPYVLRCESLQVPVMCEETFGPVFPIMSFNDDEEVLALANDSAYGLAASIWTQSAARANHFANELEVGTVAINDQVKSNMMFPFGGIKRSGYGREMAKYGLTAFSNIKTICKPIVSGKDI